MTTTEINAQIFRDMAEIAEDEALMKQLAKYLKKLVAKKNDPTKMTKEEFFRRVEEAKNGPLYELQPGETLDDLISRVV